MAKSRSRFLLLLLVFFLFVIISVSAHGGAHDDDADADTDSDADSPKPDLRSRPLILVKIWCLILVFVGTFVGGISPCFLKWNEGFLVIGTQFAGGVFLGTALMHFLSDSNETFGDLTDKEYPFAFMLASAGYLITMLADCVIYFFYDRQINGSAAGDPRLQGVGHKGDEENGRNSRPQLQELIQSLECFVLDSGFKSDKKANRSVMMELEVGRSFLEDDEQVIVEGVS